MAAPPCDATVNRKARRGTIIAKAFIFWQRGVEAENRLTRRAISSDGGKEGTH